VCRKQWAAPRASPMFVNADVTSCSIASVTDSDTALITTDSSPCSVTDSDTALITTDSSPSVPGCSLPADTLQSNHASNTNNSNNVDNF